MLVKEKPVSMKKKPKINAIDVVEQQEKSINHFAQGFNFYKMFWTFFIGSFLGVIVETLYCIAMRHHYESRVGLIYGPFNLVYGFGAVAMTVGLYWFRNKRDWYIMIGGFAIGSVVEYGCSWFQELMFGSVSWDYSKMTFNIQGRINLLYSFFWGILALLWVKEIYPRMARLIMKIPNKVGKPLTWFLLAFMVFNTFMSGIAVYRWVQRRDNIAPKTSIGTYMDKNYTDERLTKIYPNMKFEK